MMNMGRLKRYVLASLAIIALVGVNMIPTKASARLFYEGTCSFAVARRSFYDSVDFNYATQTFQLPLLNDMGIVDSECWGLPSAYSGITYSNIPAYFSCTCPDLVKNGGYLVFSFMYCYWAGDGISNVQLANGRRGKAFLSEAGSLEYAINNGTDLGYCQLRTSVTTPNTVLVNNTPASTGNEVLHVTELNLPSGVNFPKVAIFDLDDDKGTLNAYGLTDAYILGYGETAEDSWHKNNAWQFVLSVPAQPDYSSNINKDTIWIDMTNCFLGSFTPVSFNNYNLQTNAGIYFIQSTLSGSRSNLVYMCPIACYACSSDTYEAVEYYLDNISTSLASIADVYGSPSASQQAWLDQYTAYVNQQKVYASSASNAMNYTFTSPNNSNLDVSSYVDSTAKSRFGGVLSLIFGHSKIGAILILSGTCAIIGYIFFGKRSQG